MSKNNIENTNNTMNTNKKTVRLTEDRLRKMIGEAVKKVLNETIGDGSFPNADALIGHKVESLNRRKTLKEEYGASVQSDDQEYEDSHSSDAINFGNDIQVVPVNYRGKAR